MKPIRKEYPPIRAIVNHGKTYYRVDLRRKHHVGANSRQFTDKQQAVEFAKGIAEQVAKQGLESIAKHGTDARIAVWSEQLSRYGKTVEDAMQLALKHFAGEKIKMETPFASELLTLWVDDKTTNVLKPLRPRSLKAIRVTANGFKSDFGTMRIAELDAKFIEKYITDKNVSNQTRKNILNLLSQFFNWAIQKQHITIANPTRKIEIVVTNGTPKFFTVEQCEMIMRKAKDTPVQSYYALCLFAGIRPDEVKRMTWDNINMDTHEITIQADIAKTKKPRLFGMEQNLIEWLKAADKDKPLIPVNQRKLSYAAINDINFKWIQDGCRHTMATMHYAKFKNMETLRHTLGNSPAILDKFYKGIISKTEVEKFWNISPATTATP